MQINQIFNIIKKLTLIIVILVTILTSCEKEEIVSPTKELRYEVVGNNFNVSYINELGENIKLNEVNSFNKTMILENGFDSKIVVICTEQIELTVYLDGVIVHNKTDNWINFNLII